MDWGDDSPIETVPPTWYNPGESGPGIANHSWDTKKAYTIKAKAKDIYGAESEWGMFNVTITKNKQSIHQQNVLQQMITLLRGFLFNN